MSNAWEALENTVSNTPAHSRIYGVVIYLDHRWSLVAQPGITGTPTTIFDLTPHTEKSIRHWITRREKTALDRTIFDGDANACAGQFRLLPTRTDGLYEIEAYEFPQAPTHRELRIANIALTIAAHPLPDEFTSVLDTCPEFETPVVALRKAQTPATTFEVITARYMPDYRPHDPWRLLNLSAASASGSPILAWSSAIDTIRPLI
jgi:hypothetical protein